MLKRHNMYINARFRNQKVTGVQRYANEITSRFKCSFRLFSPPANMPKILQHFWEQFILPWLVKRDGILFSPANIGPVLFSRQVIVIHDVAVLEHPEWFSRAFYCYYRIMLPWLARKALHIITVSEYSKKRISEVLRVELDKISVVPNGVGEQFAVQTLDKVRRVKGKYCIETDYILLLSSIEPRKNIAAALEAWRRVESRYDDISIVVAGSKNNLFENVEIKSSELERIRFIGYVDDCDLPSLLSGAVFLLYPSVYEGFGLPLLEAMACGTPVLSSNLTAIPEVVGSSGVLVNPLNIEEIAQGIEALLDDARVRQSLIKSGLDRVKNYSWSKSAEKTEFILKSFGG